MPAGSSGSEYLEGQESDVDSSDSTSNSSSRPAGPCILFSKVCNFFCLLIPFAPSDSTLQKTPTDLEVSTLLATWLSNARDKDAAKIEKLQKEIEVHKERERELKSQTCKTRADLRHIAKKTAGLQF